MIILPAIKAIPDRIPFRRNDYVCLTNILSILKQRTKDLEEIIRLILRIEVDTNFFTVCFPYIKLQEENKFKIAS